MKTAEAICWQYLKFSQPGKVNSIWSKPVIQQLFKNAAGYVKDFQNPEACHSEDHPQEMNNNASGQVVRVDHCIRVHQSNRQVCIGCPWSDDVSRAVVKANLDY